MSNTVKPNVPVRPWQPFLAGLRRHGAIGRVFILFTAALAAVDVVIALLGFHRVGAGLATAFVGGAAIQLTLAAGVALHKRAVMTGVFALSIIIALGSLYQASGALRQPLPLIGWMVVVALYSMFAWYFGRVRRASCQSAAPPGV